MHAVRRTPPGSARFKTGLLLRHRRSRRAGNGTYPINVYLPYLPGSTYKSSMTYDPIQRFVALRQQLQKEKTKLEGRLAEINRALGDAVSQVPSPSLPSSSGQKPRTGRIKNSISLPKAVIQVTSAKPLTKNEILEAVQQLGYKFITSNPIRSLNPNLYGKNSKVRNVDGKFGPANRQTAVAVQKKASVTAKRNRTVSPATRAKLAAIAKARWSKAKKSGKKSL